MAAAGPSYELTCLRAVAMRTSQRRRITTVTPIPIPFLQHTTLKSGSSFGQLRAIPPSSEFFDFGMNRIRTLYTGTAPAEGVYETVWDGRDEGGHSVAGGVYFYSVETASGFINGKILLLD